MLGGRGSPLRGQNRTLLAASCIRISNSRRHHSTRLNLSDFVDLRKGDALALPLEDRSVDVAAQNCLFNIFRERDLARALTEMYRVLKPHGRLVLSDPVCEQAMPATLRNDDRLRAMCLSGAIPLDDYLAQLTEIGFGTIEVRARRPYRVLAPSKYATSKLIYIESVEVCATIPLTIAIDRKALSDFLKSAMTVSPLPVKLMIKVARHQPREQLRLLHGRT